MYVIVTTNKEIAERAKFMGADVFKVSDTEVQVPRKEVEVSVRDEAKLTQVMHEFAFKANLKGYDYIKTILEKCMLDKKYHKSSMTKVIYPGVAKVYDTTMSRVERAIRHSIERSFEQAPGRYEELFGIEMTQAPTNSEFISMLSEYLAQF